MTVSHGPSWPKTSLVQWHFSTRWRRSQKSRDIILTCTSPVTVTWRFSCKHFRWEVRPGAHRTRNTCGVKENNDFTRRLCERSAGGGAYCTEGLVITDWKFVVYDWYASVACPLVPRDASSSIVFMDCFHTSNNGAYNKLGGLLRCLENTCAFPPAS